MAEAPNVNFVDREDYYDARDIERAVRHAHSVIDALALRQIDPLNRQREIELALEVECDAPGGDARRAYKAIELIQDRYRRPEEWEDADPTANAARISCGLATLAEVAHRVGRYRQSVIHTSAALTGLANAAGGRDALLKLVASPKHHPLAEAVTAVFAIRVASLRRAGYPKETEKALRMEWADILPAYLASGRIDFRTHALATQTLFEQASLGLLEHLSDLRTISTETRSDTKRAQTTAPLVDMQVELALGNREEAQRLASLALQRVRRFPLPRHEAMINRYGYCDIAAT